jgi:signal transduction histidine kinase
MSAQTTTAVHVARLAGGSPRSDRVALWAAPLLTAMAIASMIVLRLVLLPDQITPIGYGIALVAFLWLRNRSWLWIATFAFAVISVLEIFVPMSTNTAPATLPLQTRLADFVLVMLELAVVSGVIHAIIGTRLDLERRNIELSNANRELAAREEKIARQNEELKSQAVELERQSKEMRAGHAELAGRERTLATLLSLSRALGADLSRPNTMRRICDTMGQLLAAGALPDSGSITGAAILEHDGDDFVVRCHHGFGPEGPVADRVPLDRAFASLVLADGRTVCMQDLSLRPDRTIPQPRDSHPFVAVLAAPLRVAGWPVGTLEIYSSSKAPWAPAHVALLESLAAQASVSLEAAHLFDSVAAERRRLEAVLRAAPIGVAVANADCTDVRLNPAGAAMFNVPPDTNVAGIGGIARDARTVTGPWLLFVDGQPLPPEKYPLVSATRGEETRGQEIEVLLPTGKRIVLLTNASPMTDREGRSAGSVAAFVDITPQKELQRELDTRRREAEEASVHKTQFLAAVSHDIRTPANAISLLAELVRRSAANPALAADVPGLARELHGSAVFLVTLLSDVLDVARFDSGKIELQESEFALGPFLRDENRQMQPLAREKGLELIYTPIEGPLRLRTDRIKLSRILGNLVGNAIKFTEKGTVRVDGSGTADGGLQIRVSDSGIGIASEHLRHIFDEFFQLRNPERDRNKGSGLGLTICKRLVDAMGGRLEVQSTVNQGSTFILLLPASAVIG